MEVGVIKIYSVVVWLPFIWSRASSIFNKIALIAQYLVETQYLMYCQLSHERCTEAICAVLMTELTIHYWIPSRILFRVDIPQSEGYSTTIAISWHRKLNTLQMSDCHHSLSRHNSPSTVMKPSPRPLIIASCLVVAAHVQIIVRHITIQVRLSNPTIKWDEIWDHLNEIHCSSVWLMRWLVF